MATFTENWGQSLPSSGSSYDVCQNALNSNVNRTNRKIITHTQSPIVTGTSVLGIVYSDGILLAADTLDLLGGKFESDSIATGFGAHLAQPILRRTIEEKSGGAKELSFEEAKSAIDTCMRVLYYRDARSLNKVWLPFSN
ncbi:subunit beta of proteasome [Mitosporidium daphniae]|uniref:Subunit beta of proteasome n=1 Tax=Mitosporidium daphniae TaxID=1485682 RepID=A0A098VRH2_9MICR|nr:subunit beta of proteasome [Mitosporidium daphniae]KGG51658.1 subunit beta of proteasome [Mitosporidium daphniae]|eukprot:XP_013238085.1 subunit beta of proteasome [Mitosporidium daphniae]